VVDSSVHTLDYEARKALASRRVWRRELREWGEALLLVAAFMLGGTLIFYGVAVHLITRMSLFGG
jgi:hypothetical protein